MFHVSEFDNWYSSKYTDPLLHEIREFSIIVRNSNFDTTAVDVGANCGVWTKKLARHFKSVKAYEPIKSNFDALLKNCNSANVNLNQLAIGNLQTEVYLKNERGNTGGSFVTKDIPRLRDVFPHFENHIDFQKSYQSTLDIELTDEKIGFIKIDVEGYELEVLEGSEKTISRNRPILLIEINGIWNYRKQKSIWGYKKRFEIHRSEIIELLAKYDYNFFHRLNDNYIFSTKPLKI